MKAFIFDPIWNKLVTNELLSNLHSAGIEPVITEEIAPIAACKRLFDGSDARILAVNPDYVSWNLSSDDYKEIPNLKAILGAASSFSWIDRKHADAHNIPICNIRNFSTEAVAEWAITMMMNLARQVPRLIKDGFPLDFDRDFMKYRGVELHGKTAGIIGLGNIGTAIARRCAGLGMKVLYWSNSPKTVPYTHSDLQSLFANADVIFPTLVDNEEARNIVTTNLLRSMKPTSLLVSVVHGLFDESVVLEMVRDNRLFGFGFEAQPTSFANYEGNVWAAPSYAWDTDGSMNNSMTKWVANMIDASRGSFPTRVN
ncbi:MAG: 2-hydroxyacid dehydrogenase [Bdellovibrionota bacterium]|jgi:lactate dehydrogenase-like 2-hydroxyacid dehydrogenase